MSAPEQETFEGGRSSVKVTRNAKGDPQWEIKVRVGDTAAEVAEAREIALATHRALEAELVRGFEAAA